MNEKISELLNSEDRQEVAIGIAMVKLTYPFKKFVELLDGVEGPLSFKVSLAIDWFGLDVPNKGDSPQAWKFILKLAESPEYQGRTATRENQVSNIERYTVQTLFKVSRAR